MAKVCASLILALMTAALPAYAEDWTVDGKTYHNVVVGQVEPDRVHITYDGGIGTVPLADLPPDLRKRFNYDATQAKAAAAAQAQHDAASDAMADQQRAKDYAAADTASSSPGAATPAKTKGDRIAELRAKVVALQGELDAEAGKAAAGHFGFDDATSRDTRIQEERRELAALQKELYALSPSDRPMPAPLPVSERANVLDPYTRDPNAPVSTREAGGG
ncbi:MAG: hypothetical protein WDO13_17785 [Verrucomicrobiota bacterium]